jgi:hypothetical protein
MPTITELKYHVKWGALVFFVAIAGTKLIATEPGKSEWVRQGADGKLIYKATLAGDRILDFSFAGYMGGGVRIPTVATRRTVKPSGGEDDTAAIQKAIDEVGALNPENGFRGAVVLAPGIFTCLDSIRLSVSGVVLRGSESGGSSQAKTTIKMAGKPHTAIVIRGGRGQESEDRSNGTLSSAVGGALGSASLEEYRLLRINDDAVTRGGVRPRQDPLAACPLSLSRGEHLRH